MDEDVSIPSSYTFKDLVTAKVREEHARFFKVMDVQLKRGDCLYIPAYWWYQTQTLTPKKPQEPEKLAAYEEQVKNMSISVDFWYEVHSYWLDNMMQGIQNGHLA